MRLKHLTISLLIMLPALAALCGLGSCTDDYLYNSVKGGLEPGIPVEISLGLQVPEADEAIVGGSRTTTETETDRTVYDLYLFIFDQNTNQLKSKYYFPQINSSANTACDPAYSSTGSAAVLRKRDGNSRTSGTIEKIHTTTGPSRIVGVANCNRKGSAMILNRLSKVETVQDLRDIMVSTVDPDSKLPDFEQSLTVMSGYYCDDNDDHQANHLYTPCDFVSDTDPSHSHKGYVNIDKEKLDGTLWLTPLQSRVKFLVLSEGPTDEAGAIPQGKFELQSWQVYNLPGRTPLFCRGYDDNDDPLEPNPVKTLVITRFDTDDEVQKDEIKADETYSSIAGFNFFVPDNHPGKGSADIQTYGDRAKWTGADYTSPTPPEEKNYTYAPDGATYVVLRGTYTGASWVTEDDGTENGNRTLKNVTGDVTYTIFLGHNSGSAAGADNRDFNTYRNYNYTYIVRVAGVDKITVEVNKDEEDRPDAEGDIITSTSSNIVLDAHYEQRVVSIKKQNIIDAIKADNFQVSVTVPLFRVSRRAYKYDKDAEDPWADTNTALPYMEWLEFYEHTAEDLAENRSYIYYTDARGNGTVKKTLDVKKFMQRLYEYANDESAPEELTFTVFFSEYLYTSHPVTGNTVTWQELLRDGQSRRFTMLGTSKFSTDHNSSYTTSGTTFVQRCMQTIYDVDMAGLQRGWATEVIEEDIFGPGINGVPYDMYNANPKIQWNGSALGVTKFGRQNCWRVNSGKNGNDGGELWEYKLMIGKNGYLNPPTDKGVNRLKNETNLLSACLQRNRDLNGNGYIDREEFVWYIPSQEQMQLLYIGYGALTDDVKLYDTQGERQNLDLGNKKYTTRHYLTSSLNKIWAEEGASFSQLGLGTSDTHSWLYDKQYYVRCTRSLGTNDALNNDIPWNIDQHTDYQFQSIYEYQQYDAETEAQTDKDATFKDHKLGRITMRYLNPQSLINVPRFTETPGLVHSYSENNFPTFQFEIADTLISVTGTEAAPVEGDKGKMEQIFTQIKSETDFSPCNLLGPGWRMPTITELAVMHWAWVENWNIDGSAKISQYFKPGTSWFIAFAGDYKSGMLLSRTEFYYKNISGGLRPPHDDYVRTFHIFEQAGGNSRVNLTQVGFGSMSSNVPTVRCVRSYTAPIYESPAPATSRATAKRKLRK